MTRYVVYQLQSWLSGHMKYETTLSRHRNTKPQFRERLIAVVVSPVSETRQKAHTSFSIYLTLTSGMCVSFSHLPLVYLKKGECG
jgi:hypothetical protein